MFIREERSCQMSTVRVAREALVSAVASPSSSTEMPEPLCPPKGSSAPPSSMADGSVVGRAPASTPQPSGIGVPSLRAETTLP